MKKLLYTLILGLLVVSCDKSYEESIETPQASQEIILENPVDINELQNRLIRLLDSSKDFPQKGPSSARTAGDHIKLISGTSNGVYFEFLFSDDIEVCNLESYSYLSTIYLVLNADNHTEIRVGAASGDGSLKLGTIEVDLSFLYTITFSEGLRVNLSDLAVNLVDGMGGTSFTFN